MLQGAWDQRGGPHIWNWPLPIPLSARNDVLVFQTEPLAEDLEVTGEIAVKLWASSSAVDTDFTAKLIDVYPPSADFPGGFDLNIGDGIVRARFRESLKKEKLMEPGDDLPVHDQALSDVERLQEGPPHPRRHLQQQLPALRREPEHRRAAERPPPRHRLPSTRSTTTARIRRTSCCRWCRDRTARACQAPMRPPRAPPDPIALQALTSPRLRTGSLPSADAMMPLGSASVTLCGIGGGTIPENLDILNAVVALAATGYTHPAPSPPRPGTTPALSLKAL